MNRSQAAQASRRSNESVLTVFHAAGQSVDSPETTVPEGFAGRLSLRGPAFLSADEAADTLVRLDALIAWAQAQQAHVVVRIEELFARGIAENAGREDPAWAQSLAAAEISALLRLPHMSALRLVNESHNLCSGHTPTLRRLSEGRISYRHARVVLEEVQSVPELPPEPTELIAGPDPEQVDTIPPLPGLESDPRATTADQPGEASGEEPGPRARFEADLLGHAEGLTAARFTAKARRLREALFPATIQIRHKDALAQRRVCFEALPDGMSCISAFLAAEKGQALHAALSAAARGEKAAGDIRSMDQLRADVFTFALLGESIGGVSRHGMEAGPDVGSEVGSDKGTEVGSEVGSGKGSEVGSGRASRRGAATGTAKGTTPARESGPRQGTGGGSPPPRGKARPTRSRARNRVKTEVMVLINADTLTGLNDSPAELNGYGPLSPETGRRMVQEALSWTPLAQDPRTGEILAVGRRRRIPSGLKRWLQARDATCRFPGCGINVRASQIDHTRPWAQGGNTEHSNLEHLCHKHHRFKTLGHWKARQPEAGTIEWISPLGRTYRTSPILTYGKGDGATDCGTSPSTQPDGGRSWQDDPPPF